MLRDGITHLAEGDALARKVGIGLFLAAVAAFAALMGVGGGAFAALLIAWAFVPAPFVYVYLWLRPSDRRWPRVAANIYMSTSALLTAALLLGVAWIGSERAIHPSICDGMPELSEYPVLETEIEPVEFHSADGTRLAGWLAAGERDEAVVLLHGYRCDRREVLPHADMLSDAGFTVLLFDFRNRGKSGGEFVSLGYHEREDILAADRPSQVQTQPGCPLDRPAGHLPGWGRRHPGGGGQRRRACRGGRGVVPQRGLDGRAELHTLHWPAGVPVRTHHRVAGRAPDGHRHGGHRA